jgi:hypothetical protein
MQAIIESRVHIEQEFLYIPKEPNIIGIFLACQMDKDMTAMLSYFLIYHLCLVHASHQQAGTAGPCLTHCLKVALFYDEVINHVS